jgi:hypothetical protein
MQGGNSKVFILVLLSLSKDIQMIFRQCSSHLTTQLPWPSRPKLPAAQSPHCSESNYLSTQLLVLVVSHSTSVWSGVPRILELQLFLVFRPPESQRVGFLSRLHLVITLWDMRSNKIDFFFNAGLSHRISLWHQIPKMATRLLRNYQLYLWLFCHQDCWLTLELWLLLPLTK